MAMILSYTQGMFSMLFTGDVEGEGEKQLIKSIYDEGEFTVLKVAHHGSKNSSAKELLSSVNPEIAIISAGIDNSYGHPHRETVERLKEQGCRIYCTKDRGAIKIRTNGKRVLIDSYINS